MTPPEREEDRRRCLDAAARDHLAAGSGERAFVLARTLFGQAAPGRARGRRSCCSVTSKTSSERSRPAVEHYRAALADAAELPELELIIHERLAAYTRLTEGIAVARTHAQAAVRLADHLGDDALTARALAALAVVRFDEGEPDSLELAKRAVALVELSDDASAIRDIKGVYGHVLTWSGWIDEAREILSELVRSAERDDAGIGAPLFYLCIVEERAGRLALARAHAERKRELAYQDGGQELADTPSVLMSIARVAAIQGEVDLARELAERTLDHPGVQAPFAFYRAATALLATARCLVRRSGSGGRAILPRSKLMLEPTAAPRRRSTSPSTSRRCSSSGGLDEARAMLTMWEQASRKLGHRWAIPQTVRCRGLAAAAEGDIAAAVELLAQAVAEHEAVGDPFGRARALLRSASRAGALGRSARPARPIEAALAGFEEIGAAGWAEKARGELGRIGGRQREEGLTPAERRVAKLVAEGKTNREVGPRSIAAPGDRAGGGLRRRQRDRRRPPAVPRGPFVRVGCGIEGRGGRRGRPRRPRRRGDGPAARAGDRQSPRQPLRGVDRGRDDPGRRRRSRGGNRGGRGRRRGDARGAGERRALRDVHVHAWVRCRRVAADQRGQRSIRLGRSRRPVRPREHLAVPDERPPLAHERRLREGVQRSEGAGRERDDDSHPADARADRPRSVLRRPSDRSSSTAPSATSRPPRV